MSIYNDTGDHRQIGNRLVHPYKWQKAIVQMPEMVAEAMLELQVIQTSGRDPDAISDASYY